MTTGRLFSFRHNVIIIIIVIVVVGGGGGGGGGLRWDGLNERADSTPRSPS